MKRVGKTSNITSEKKEFFVTQILLWYEKHKRNFPWRKTTDPYKILIAELMLQRTRAEQVEKVWSEFIKEFPDIISLSKAPYERIEHYFSMLGLRWRAKKLFKLVRKVIEKHNGQIPRTREDLLSLPGVGEYISSAILSFAYNIPVAVVDSNVARVIMRYFGITPKGEGRRDPKIIKLASEILPSDKHKEFNWAIIDFAAKICLPKNPRCAECPLSEKCSFYKYILKQE